MKGVLLIAFLLACSVLYSQEKKVVFIIADGIPADVLQKLNTPNIDKIIRDGSYFRAYVGGEKGAYSETPTISAVSYNTILTGVWVNKHNVFDNDVAAPNYNYWNIFRLYKAQHPSKPIAIFSSWLDNRTKLVGEGLEAAGNVKFDHHFDGYEHDTINFRHDAGRDFMHRIDERVIDEAAKTIREKAPNLSWVYLEYTDDMGHMYGDSPQFYKAVELLDKQVGKLYEAVLHRQKNNKEDWLFILTTDHGRDELTGKHHGGQSDRQRSGWIVMNKKNTNAYANHYDISIADIAPTIASYLQLKMPENTKREVDGISLLNNVSIADAQVNHFQDMLDITWKSFDDSPVKIFVATTNNFKTGGKDEYRLMATVAASQGYALIDVKNLPSEFYKVVIEGKNNTLNRWWVSSNENRRP